MIPPSPVHACIHTLTHSTPWHAFTTSSFIHYWGEAEFCYSVHSHYSVFQPEVGITTPVSLQQGTFASIMLSALVFYQFTWTVLRETLDVTQGLLALTGVTTWLIAVLPLCVCVSVCALIFLSSEELSEFYTFRERIFFHCEIFPLLHRFGSTWVWR